MQQLTIPGTPRTKKNSPRIINIGNGAKHGHKLLPSKAYERYEADAGWFIRCPGKPIDYPVNIKCVYYMPTRGKVDLVNLLEATCDILVKYGVLVDDNASIVTGHDGSRVLYDKDNPRVEIEIEEI